MKRGDGENHDKFYDFSRLARWAAIEIFEQTDCPPPFL